MQAKIAIKVTLRTRHGKLILLKHCSIVQDMNFAYGKVPLYRRKAPYKCLSRLDMKITRSEKAAWCLLLEKL